MPIPYFLEKLSATLTEEQRDALTSVEDQLRAIEESLEVTPNPSAWRQLQPLQREQMRIVGRAIREL